MARPQSDTPLVTLGQHITSHHKRGSAGGKSTYFVKCKAGRRNVTPPSCCRDFLCLAFTLKKIRQAFVCNLTLCPRGWGVPKIMPPPPRSKAG